ncbi:MAG: SUMF1/EgtB/PvdO family nonheme iron enzyme [Nitrospira sp.]
MMTQLRGWWILGLCLMLVSSAAAADPAAVPGVAGSVKGKDGAPMVLIPAGPFLMGSNDGLPNERPEHTVTVKAFYIDLFEVTAGRYEKYLESGKQTAPSGSGEDDGRVSEDRPVVGVTWKEADGYCRWAGKRLPTEAEWEKAARGTDGRRYPWGQMQPFVDIANYNRGLWVSDAITLVPVGSGVEGMSVRHGLKEGGKSPYGLYHMAGNAAEWVNDWYDREYYQHASAADPAGPTTGEKRVLRGGSWADLPTALRVTARFSAEPDFEERTIGFRCAMDAGR